jgi:hypothetical protein
MNPTVKTKKINGLVVVLALVASSFFFYRCSTNPIVDKQLDAAVQEVNTQCPLMIDAQTRLDNAFRPEKNVFQYNYTLINLTKAELNVEELKGNLTPTMTNNVKTNPQLAFFRDNQITMSYYYKDKEGNFVMKIDITPDDYKN